MTERRFEPWIGPEYHSGTVRLMVIGESHYGKAEEDEPGLTKRVVDSWCSGEKNLRYFATLARVLTGQERETIDRSAAMSGIVFTNYLQRLLHIDNKEQPDEQDFVLARQPFLDLVQELDPTHILVTSVRAFTRMPPELMGYKQALGDDVRYVCEYPTRSGKTYATAVPHLSRQSAEPWIPVVEAFRRLPPIQTAT